MAHAPDDPVPLLQFIHLRKTLAQAPVEETWLGLGRREDGLGAPLADKAQADSRPIQAHFIAFPFSTAKIHQRL